MVILASGMARRRVGRSYDGLVQDGGNSHPGFLDAFRALFAACRGYTTGMSCQLQQSSVLAEETVWKI